MLERRLDDPWNHASFTGSVWGEMTTFPFRQQSSRPQPVRLSNLTIQAAQRGGGFPSRRSLLTSMPCMKYRRARGGRKGPSCGTMKRSRDGDTDQRTGQPYMQTDTTNRMTGVRETYTIAATTSLTWDPIGQHASSLAAVLRGGNKFGDRPDAKRGDISKLLGSLISWTPVQRWGTACPCPRSSERPVSLTPSSRPLRTTHCAPR
jgi:hypothetical protein